MNIPMVQLIQQYSNYPSNVIANTGTADEVEKNTCWILVFIVSQKTRNLLFLFLILLKSHHESIILRCDAL